MKTLKKTLCLVLAVVMVVGVLVLPANAATTTTEDTDATAAFKTLNEYGVMYGVDANNTPALSKNINRQDMAAIVYRIMTGDTTDKYKDNYASAADEFADSATFATWAKGYIGYVRNQGIFVGDNKGNFKPTEEIAGSDVLTVLLRCIGYGKNNEFTGANYAQNALTQATQIHMFGGVTGYKPVAEKTMDKAISRGVVAKLTFNAVKAPMVTYFNDTYSAYSSQGRPVAPNTTGATKNPSLIELVPGTATSSQDDWGVPTVKTPNTLYFNNPIPAVTVDKTVTSSKALVEYYHAVTQCDVADDLDLDDAVDCLVYVNGKDNKTTIELDPINTVAKIGAQGRYTGVYTNPDADTKDDYPYIIVYKDTLLAEVTSVVAPTFDAKGHIKTPAKLDMTVYTAGNSSTPQTQAVTQTKSDGTAYAYAKGDMLLVNYIQNGLGLSTANVDVSGTNAGYGDTVKGDDAAAKGKNVKIVDKATAFDGKQTTIYYNEDKHTIDKVDYNDNNRFHLNDAGTKGDTFTWYLDKSPEGKNLIGSKIIKSEANFGVITRIWAEIANGATSVKANVTYVDGRTATLDVGTIITDTVTTNAHVSAGTPVANNDALKWGPATYANASSHDPMKYAPDTAGTKSTAFYVSNSYEENLAADKVIGASTPKTNHIIGANLFKIVANGSKYDFVEVIGNGKNADYSDTDPAVDYAGLGNASTEMVPNKVANGTVVANDSTRYLIKTGGDGTDAKPYTFTTVVGYTNIVEYDLGEVDYADVDGDGYADVVYITAIPKAATGDHIFFSEAVLKTDKGGNTWELHKSYDIASGITTVYGWVDGVYGGVKVKEDATNSLATASFNAFTNSTGNQLWLVTVKGDLVTDIDGKLTGVDANKPITSATASKAYGTGVALDGANGMNDAGDAYEEMSLIAYMSTGTTGTEAIDGTALKLGGNHFNITTLKDKATVGNWADVLVKDTVVYLVYNSESYVVSQAYIVAAGDGSGYGPEKEPEVDPDSESITLNEDLTITYNWHGDDFGYVAPSATAVADKIEAYLKTAAGGSWTTVEVTATAGTYSFKCSKTGSVRTYTWDSTDTDNGFVQSIRIYVGKNGKTAKLVKTGAKVSEIEVQNHTGTEKLYVYTKLGSAAKQSLTQLNASTVLAEGDIIYDDAVYMKAPKDISEVHSDLSTDNPFSTSPSSVSVNVTYDEDTKLVEESSEHYIQVGKTYTINVKLTETGTALTVKTGGTVKATLSFTPATNIKAVPSVTLLKAGDKVETGNGSTYSMTFSVVITDDSSIADFTAITVTLVGDDGVA